jgi:hypothetical protein
LPQPFNDYNVTDSRKPHKTREPRRRIALQRGSLYAGTAEKPYFMRFSGIEKIHRNSIITVDLWQAAPFKISPDFVLLAVLMKAFFA